MRDRLANGERWWVAEIGFRTLGLVLLGVCASLATWLHRMLQPSSQGHAIEFATAALAVACLCVGLALLAEGPGLFRLIPVPNRHLIL